MKPSEIRGVERFRFSVPENQLVALLRARHADTGPGVTTLDRRGELQSLSYAELYAQAERLCAGLQEAGLRAGDRAVLQLVEPLAVMIGFWGCVLAGVVPVPLNTAPFYHRANSQTERLVAVLQRFNCRAILASTELVEPLQTLLAAPMPAAVLDIDSCLASSRVAKIHEPAPDDPAAMFLTSGSTGAAKGVVQSHAAMLAMADATIQMNGFTAADVTLNWMSLDHAGSLVFLGVMPLALGAQQVHVPIEYVLKDPLRWLDLIDRWSASITWAPNFVFSLLLDREQQLRERHWDLSCMRFMVNAGEAVVSATARRFIALLQHFALPEDALRPAFGMVETCSGITWSTGFRLQHSADADLFVSLGPVIPGAAMKIVDAAGTTLPEGQEGRLLLQGASVFKGYEGEDELNRHILLDGWLVTGDLGFIRSGELYVTGREKDMVIINGNNHYCHEIEAVIAAAGQVASDCVAAAGVRLAGENTEGLVIFYALAADAAPDLDREVLEKTLRGRLAQATGIAPRAFVLLQAEQFPRTEIGKIKRALLRQRFEAGDFGAQAAGAAQAAGPQHIASEPGDSPASYRALLDGISAIWCRVLKLDAPGLDDGFFELGGSSLLAIQVLHELELLLGREVSMLELFDTPTIRSMAQHFSGTGSQVTPSAPAENAFAARPQAGSGDIAVIGIGCRFPGAHGPAAFWQVLQDGVETISFFTPEDAIAAGLSPERAHDPAQVNAAPVLEDVEGCDLDFWKYAKREAELLDPQQRVFLETAWEAFEDAGYVPGAALGRVGVYASAATNTYLQNNVYANRAWVAANGGSLFTVNSFDGFNVMVANDKDYLPTRVSYKLDLVGPSMGIQTACSSTLVAVHEAVRALRTGECDLALAGGCALMLPQHAGHYYDEGMINSPDGHCRAYDRDAKGTIFGSGSGAVLLKRLDQAQADGDAIYAVIKGSGVVNDGGQKMGFTAPSMLGEYRAITRAIEDAGIDADSIGFIEGHGTGTPIGDPIEVQALTRAFRHSTRRSGYCALGSVKTNIGHMGIASGIAGFIKAVLALHHKTIPATLHFREANPAIDIGNTPFYVNNATRAWDAGAQPRRAGVNSLGIGGTNVHVILEEAPTQPREPGMPGVQVLPVSAGSAAALSQQLTALAALAAGSPQLSLADLCFTQQRGRAAMSHRFACAVSQRDTLLSELHAAAAAAATAAPEQQTQKARIVFMFTGQGSQYAGMGRVLYATQPVFREALDAVADLFSRHRAHAIRDLLLAAPDDAAAEALLGQTQYTQVALFCLQVALVQLYRRFGIEPEFIIGHSIGEIAGVWAAGGLSLPDAVQLVEARSRLMQAVAAEGAMASVKADAATVEKLLAEAGVDCEIAACNSPFDTTLTGPAAAITTACDFLQSRDLRVTRLNVSHAFHSQHMEAMQAAFETAIAGLAFRPTTVPVYSNLDGQALDAARHAAAYWIAQLRAPVQFMQGVQQVVEAGGRCFIEIGPSPVLCGLGRALDSEQPLQWLPTLRKGRADDEVFAAALASLFTLGHDLDWSAYPRCNGRRTHLPTYPWQRQRCWIEPDAGGRAALQDDPLLARTLALPRLGQQLYAIEYAPAVVPVLLQHRVFGGLVPPAALYLSQLLHTAADFSGRRELALADVNFVAPLHIDTAGAGREVQILFAGSSEAANIELSSQPAGLRLHAADARSVQVHVTAELLPAAAAPAAARVDLAAIGQRCSEVLDPQRIEAHMRAMQVELGESFVCFSRISRGKDEALALLDVPTTAAARIAQGIPAGLIDCHWQTILAALPALPAATVVPTRIETVSVYSRELPAQVWAHAVVQQQSPKRIVATVSLLTATGELLLETRGIELSAVAVDSFRHAALQPRVYTRRWETLARDTEALPGSLAGDILLAGPARAVARLATQLRHLGIESQRLADEGDMAGLARRKQPCTLVYVDDLDDVEPSGSASGAALNRFMAALEPVATVIRQVLVLTATSSATTPATLVARRCALQVQTMSAAHELTGLNIRAVEMDQEQSSVQALLPLLARVAYSGLRLRISDGAVSVLKALPLQPATATLRFAPDQLQMITGGLGGLGLQTAQWMHRHGARRFLLAGRSAPSAAALAAIDALRAQGARVEIQLCDLSQPAQVQALVAVALGIAPVETLVHAAGLRRDGLIASLQDDDFSTLMQVKANAAIVLHEAFAALQPMRTLYYSSVAAWLGAAAQGNYAAANAALDGLATYYRQQDGGQRDGRHIVSVAWGPWHETGMTAQLSSSQLARISNTGYGFLDPDSAFSLLGRQLLDTSVSEICIMAADMAKLALLPGAATFWPMPAAAGNKRSAATPATAAGRTLVPALAARVLALDDVAAQDLLQEHLVILVGELTSAARVEDIDVDTGILDLGIDSLAALELRKKLEVALGLKLKSTIILDHPTLLAMARALVEMTKQHHGASAGSQESHQQSRGSKPAPQQDRADLLRQLASEIDLQERG